MNGYENFIDAAKKNGWNIEAGKNISQNFENIKNFSRFNADLPNLMKAILRDFNLISNPSDNAWFLMLSDFQETSDSPYKWNEFEQQSMDAALDDADKAVVSDFWDHHLPFFFSVKSGYSFFAIKKTDGQFGPVVFGEEPEYEETVFFSNSIEDFFDRLAAHLNGSVDPILSRVI